MRKQETKVGGLRTSVASALLLVERKITENCPQSLLFFVFLRFQIKPSQLGPHFVSQTGCFFILAQKLARVETILAIRITNQIEIQRKGSQSWVFWSGSTVDGHAKEWGLGVREAGFRENITGLYLLLDPNMDNLN